MKKTLLILVAGLACSCGTIKVTNGDFQLSRTAIGTKLGLKKAGVTVTHTNGVVEKWEIEGLQSDQVEAFKAGVEMGVKGLQKIP